MKVGSIVECVKSFGSLSGYQDNVKRLPVLGEKYIVRRIFNNSSDNAVLICLEDIVAGHNPSTGRELGFRIEYFREIEFPPSLESEIKESLTRELVEV